MKNYSIKKLNTGMNSKNFSKYLKKLNIKRNDHLIIHSSFKNISSYGFTPESLIEEIENYLKDGTLIFPTFTYEESKKTKKFHYFKSKSCVGILTEIFRKKYINNRSFHPTHSLTAVGKNYSKIINFEDKNLFKSPCGKGTVWEYLIKKNTKILLMDTLIDSCTFVHYFEELYNSNYFVEKKITNYNCVDKENKKKIFKLRNHRAGHRGFKQIYFELIKRKLLKYIYYRDVSLISFSSFDLKKVSNYLFKKNKKVSII